MKKNIYTVSEIMAHCNCTKHKVNSYIYHHHMLPYSLTTRGSKKDVRQYELTPEMEEFLKTPTEQRGEASGDPEREAKRIADGWLTGNEITEMWGCSYMKTIDILVTSHAEWKWEDGKPYQGRKLWKIPETLSRQPTVHKVSARISTKKDWIDSLPKIDGAQIKEMVLDERRGKKLVGKTVAVEMKGSGVVFTGKLEFYNMCQFFVRKNGFVNGYRHNEAKVLKEAE
jgi:hypothetical protein